MNNIFSILALIIVFSLSACSDKKVDIEPIPKPQKTEASFIIGRWKLAFTNTIDNGVSHKVDDTEGYDIIFDDRKNFTINRTVKGDQENTVKLIQSGSYTVSKAVRILTLKDGIEPDKSKGTVKHNIVSLTKSDLILSRKNEHGKTELHYKKEA
ncbi:hypothetical protein ACL9RF_01295 [Sphingobacterium sp. Mn56C]|uniref:hypothetical protein n=1 Tax=Sphingobacterium sp. Mn56C TaxID=3395261 RepID=UPI003BECBDE6